MMTYAQLKTNIQDIVENTFTDDQLAMFVQQAEQKIYNSVQLASLRSNQVGSLSAGNPYLSCPSDFLSVYSLAVVKANGEYQYLLNKDVNFIREAYPNPGTVTTSVRGLPKHYAIFGPATIDSNELTFILGPTPDAAYVVELHYYYYPQSITVTGTTWLGDNFDSALLNGSLIEAIRFMKGEDSMVKLYSDMFGQSLILLKQLGDGKQRMDAYRDGQVRYPVK